MDHVLRDNKTMLKRHRQLLPHDVVELILERLPVVSLLRFKSVSKAGNRQSSPQVSNRDN
ncbi:unnamed protein product [Brassica oleracea]